MRKRLFIALEEQQLIKAATNEVPETTEASDINAQSNFAETELDKAFEVSAALEEISLLFTTSAIDGGFNKTNSNAVNVAVEQLCSSVNVDYKQTTSLESIDNETTRATSAILAMEGLNEVIVRVWDKLVEWMGKLYDWLASLYNSIFNNAEILNKRAKEMLPKLDKIDKITKYTSFNDSYLANALSVGGKFPTNMHNEVTNLNKVLSGTIKGVSSNVHKFNEIRNDFFNNRESVKDIDATHGMLRELLSKFKISPELVTGGIVVTNPTEFGFDNLKPNLHLVAGKDMFGNKTLVAVTPNKTIEGSDAIEFLDELTCKVISPSLVKHNTIISTIVPTASVADMKTILHGVIENTETLISYKTKEKEIEDMKSKFKDNIRTYKVINFLTTPMDQKGLEFSLMIRSLQRIARYLINLLNEPITSVCSHSLRTSKALMVYVTKSMRQYTDTAISSSTGIQTT